MKTSDICLAYMDDGSFDLKGRIYK